jgi:Arc/MetJ-type ribon-helix-helix transcriptional regulator
MAKSIKVHPKKRRGRPATGKDPLVSARLPQSLVDQVEQWSAAHAGSRSEAIRRLVELGLTVKARPKQPSRARADKAKAMAANQLDQLADRSATTEEQASRKRRLLKGPEEFQNARVDRPATKK